MARDFLTNTINPKDPDGPWTGVTIPGFLIERCYKDNPTRYQNFRVVKTVLDDPKRIFSGVRVYNQGGWCYTGRPEQWHIREQVTAPFPAHLVFAVYLNPNMVVYEFRAEVADEEDPMSPRGWQDRYGGLIWKSIS
ncbi:MAG: hypothetical protein JXA69_00935 [Phycisphaerae bacterium]|nr:hypothetical protein [Phycisphaerae bacterium]